jgi:hypothetical protein
LRALTVVTGFAGRAGVFFAQWTVAEPLAGGAKLTLSRAAIASQRDVGRGVHFLLAATLHHSRQAVNGQGQQENQNGDEPEPRHPTMVNLRSVLNKKIAPL